MLTLSHGLLFAIKIFVIKEVEDYGVGMGRCVHYLRERVGVVLRSQFFLSLKLNWNFHRGRSGEVLTKKKKKKKKRLLRRVRICFGRTH